MRNYYQVLGVGRKINPHKLKKQLGRAIELARRIFVDDRKYFSELNLILDAYNTLSNDEERKKYDQWLQLKYLSKLEQDETNRFQSEYDRKVDSYIVEMFTVTNENDEIIVEGIIEEPVIKIKKK